MNAKLEAIKQAFSGESSDRVSWENIAKRLHSSGIRWTQLAQSSDDKQVYSWIDKFIARTFDDKGRHLLALTTLQGVSVEDKKMRSRQVQKLGVIRANLRDNLKKLDAHQVSSLFAKLSSKSVP